jgi:hypothetical protein
LLKVSSWLPATAIINQLKRSFNVVAGAGQIPIRKEVVKDQLGGVNAAPLILRTTLDKFFNGI